MRVKISAVFLYFFCMTIIISCSKSVAPEESEECLALRFDDFEIDKRECIYYEMYRYKEKFWTLWHCCACGYLSFPVNCEGESLCKEDFECLNDFKDHAEFLFYFTASD